MIFVRVQTEAAHMMSCGSNWTLHHAARHNKQSAIVKLLPAGVKTQSITSVAAPGLLWRVMVATLTIKSLLWTINTSCRVQVSADRTNSASNMKTIAET